MIAGPTVATVDLALARLDRWLDSMRCPGGYGGPVAHWWRDSLLYCGPGLDWRYEGIIAGYLALFERTGAEGWLAKAERAGEDLLRGQLANGHFRGSGFEQNPAVGGTPHEAAADVGLLLLADRLRRLGRERWRAYLAAAERNLRAYYFGQLWSEAEQRFWDRPGVPSFVPNKTATLIEALCLLARASPDESIVERYVRPAADAILAEQAGQAAGPLAGGIAQNVLGRASVGKYFPYYNARCIPGLLAAYRALGDGRYLDGALRTAYFTLHWRDDDGGFPQVVYPGRRVNRYPRWVAATGDLLRAFGQLGPYGLEADLEPTRRWLLSRQHSSGAYPTAEGFASQISQQPSFSLPDARDLLPVVGWNDKAFRYLAEQAGAPVPLDDAWPADWRACAFEGQRAELRESPRLVEIRREGRSVYCWRKGTTWAWQNVGPW